MIYVCLFLKLTQNPPYRTPPRALLLIQPYLYCYICIPSHLNAYARINIVWGNRKQAQAVKLVIKQDSVSSCRPALYTRHRFAVLQYDIQPIFCYDWE